MVILCQMWYGKNIIILQELVIENRKKIVYKMNLKI